MDGGKAEDEVVVVAPAASVEEAAEAVNALRAAGVDARVIAGSFDVLTFGNESRFHVAVAAADVERARAVLAAGPEGAGDLGEAVDEDDLARLAMEAPPEDREHAPDPIEEDDFVDVVVDEYRAGERYARTTLVFAWLGIFVILFALVTALRVLHPPKGVAFSAKALRWMRIARGVLYVSIAVGMVGALVVGFRLRGW